MRDKEWYASGFGKEFFLDLHWCMKYNITKTVNQLQDLVTY